MKPSIPAIPDNEIDRLAALYSLELDKITKKAQFQRIIDIAAHSLNVPIAYMSTIGSDKQLIHASCGLGFNTADRSTSFCAHTILQDTALVINDTFKDERFRDNPSVINNPHIRFHAGYPLGTPEGYNVGSLCIADYEPRKLNKKEYEIFINLGLLFEEQLRSFKLDELQQMLIESKNEVVKMNHKLNKHNKFFEQIFGQYMSEQFLSSIIDNEEKLELGGEEIFATVLISDLRDFTPLSEKYGASIVVDVLNIYLEEMINIIHKHDGYINEILGDGMLVIFGAPNPIKNSAITSIKCAKAMHSGLHNVNKTLKAKGLPTLKMGIGINSGRLIAGNIGSKKRMKYGVVGNTVNLASRIELFTVGGQTLVSERTFKDVKNLILKEGHLRVSIKGFSKPITIYDLSNAITI